MTTYKSQMIAEGGLPDNFFKSLKELVKMDDATFRGILQEWPPDAGATTPQFREKLLELSKSTGVSLQTMASAIATAAFIARSNEENAEHCEAVLDDLEAEKHISTAEKESLANKLKLYTELLDSKLKTAYEGDSNFKGTFPVLTHIRTRISSFTVFDKEYNLAQDNPETYQPSHHNTESVVFVQIDIDSYGKQNMCGFALRKDQLSKMIKRLQLAEKQLASVAGRTK